jgi:orotate phosphoribosyltransferase
VVLASGAHSDAYVDKRKAFDDPEAFELLCTALIGASTGCVYDAIIGPESGGIRIVDEMARLLGTTLRRPALHAMKHPSLGFELSKDHARSIRGARVLVVEDVMTSGTSAKGVVDLARASGGTVVGVVAMVDRSDGDARRLMGDIPFFGALVTLQLQRWDETDCPRCAAKVPINETVGKGALYMARKHGLVQ